MLQVLWPSDTDKNLIFQTLGFINLVELFDLPESQFPNRKVRVVIELCSVVERTKVLSYGPNMCHNT